VTSERGQSRGPSARCWTPIGGLSRVDRFYQVVGFALARVQARRTLGSFGPTAERGAGVPDEHQSSSFYVSRTNQPKM